MPHPHKSQKILNTSSQDGVYQCFSLTNTLNGTIV
jgi:hypothetical protein